MMMKLLIKPLLCTIACSVSLLYGQSSPNNFNYEKDLFIAQFDSYPDSDDIYAQAAVACLLDHSDFSEVNYFCVAGAYGSQTAETKWENPYIDSRSLFALGFGQEALPGDTPEERAQARWVDAHGTIILGHTNKIIQRSVDRIAKMDFASDVIVEKAKPILQAGGKVWVMEAGQSDISADWIEKLIADGVTNTATNVIIVQHSVWNETYTSGKWRRYEDNKNDWDYVTSGAHNTYIKISDGNNLGSADDEDFTPDYNETNATFLIEAKSPNNQNSKARTLWTLAEEIVLDSSHDGFVNNNGGVDFSDTVEFMWIFDLANRDAGYTRIRDFWDAFVVNTPPMTNETALVISEIMYNPSEPTTSEMGLGYMNSDYFEFIEIHNTSMDSIELEGMVFTSGIEFTFPPYTLAPDAYIAVAANISAFDLRHARHANVVGGFTSGELSNDGETIRLETALGELITEVTYDNTHPWPEQADGEGFSLVFIGTPDADISSSSSWINSLYAGGSPGFKAVSKYGVWINENAPEVISSNKTYEADPDHDGVPNIVEYAFDLNPLSADAGQLPQPVKGLESFSVTYDIALSKDDIVVEPQTSEDFSDWSKALYTNLRYEPADGFMRRTIILDKSKPKIIFRYLVTPLPVIDPSQ